MAQKTFSLSISEWINKTKAKADTVVRLTVAHLDNSLIEKSPVGDASYWKNPPPPGYVGGRFRGAWSIGINSPVSGISGFIDPSGSATRAAHAGILAQVKAGTVIYLSNNLPYAKRIEDGWSRQAPVGLVGLTVTEFQAYVDQAVREST